jgi:YVTN family beta-propeller protein
VAISYPTNEAHGEDTIAEIDINGNVIAKYDAGTDPENFAIDNRATRLYIANEDAGTASITDVKANRVIATMPVGLEPEGAAMSPDGRWVYITSEASSTVTVIDTQKGQVVKTFLVGARPREVAFSSDSARAYVTAENGNVISVVDTKLRPSRCLPATLPRSQNPKVSWFPPMASASMSLRGVGTAWRLSMESSFP